MTILEYLGADPGSLVGGWGSPIVNAAGGTVSVAGMGPTPLTGSGSLAVLRFRISDAAEYWASSPLHFEAAELNDTDIPVVTHNGAVSVQPPEEEVPLASWPLVLAVLAAASVCSLKRGKPRHHGHGWGR